MSQGDLVPLPTRPGQASSTRHSQNPESGSRGAVAPAPWAWGGRALGQAVDRWLGGEGRLEETRDRCAAKARVRPWPHLLPQVQLARGPGDPHAVTVCLLGVQAHGAGLQAPKALWWKEGPGASQTVAGDPFLPSSLGSALSRVPCPPHMVVGVKGARSPPPSSWVSPLLPCSVRAACTRSSREQPPRGPHFIAVESVRAPRTDRDMDVGGCRQKLFNMLPGEGEGGRVPQGSLVPR